MALMDEREIMSLIFKALELVNLTLAYQEKRIAELEKLALHPPEVSEYASDE